MVKRKTGICIDCPPGTGPRILIAGRCNTHYWSFRRVVSNAAQIPTPEQVEQTKALAQWFDYHNTFNNWICENCNAELNPHSPIRSYFQAHILPKAKFPSVQAVLENHMTLGDHAEPCNCHDDYDHSWQKAEGMHVFTIARERFITFKHLIDPSEYKHLPAVFHELI